MSTVQIAEVQDIQGTAYAVNADGERRLLQAGDALFDGESVETSEGGVVELTLSDGQSLVIAGQPVFLISADLIADLAPGADESALQAETLDELLAEGSLESLEQIIESTDEAEAESLDDLLAAAEEDPTASGIDFDNLAATAAGGDDSGADGGGSNIVQATRISSSGDDTSATLTEGNTQAAASTDTAGGANNSISVAVDDAFAISEDTSSAGNLADNDALAGDVTFALVDQGGPSNGAVTLNEDGTFVFTPNTDFVGDDSFQYVITDANGQTSTATVSITVEAVNDAPVAIDDVVSAQEDVLLENINVLDNDTDSDGNPLTVTNAVSAAGGVVTINADGTLSYQAPANFTGPDTINYTIDDGAGGTSTAVVNIDVAPVTDLTAENDQYTIEEGGALLGSVADNDATLSGGALTFAVATSVENGTLNFNADGSYEYTPSAGFSGADAFSYVVTDAASGESLTQTVEITVNALVEDGSDNQAPVAVDDSAEGFQDQPLRNINILGNDQDPEGGVLTVTAAESGSGAIVTINPDGTLDYTPLIGFVGADTVTYTITDADGATAQASLVIAITPPQGQNALEGEAIEVFLEDTEFLRTLPVGTTVTVASSQGSQVTISADGVMEYQAPPGFTGEDVITYTIDDGQGNVITKTVVMQVYPLDASLVGIDDAVVTPEDTTLLNIAVLANDKIAEGSEVSVVSAIAESGAQVEINADGTLNYTPVQDFTGIDSVTYTARNSDGVESTATLSIEVTPENEQPVAVNEAPIVKGEQVNALQNESLDAIAVLSNDEDPDGDPLTIDGVTASNGGTVEINPDGTLSYTPAADFIGEETLTYTVSDGQGGLTQGQVTVNVRSLADGPIALDDRVTVDEDAQLVGLDVLGNDRVAEGDTLTLVSATSEQGATVVINEDGTLDYQAPENYSGVDVVTYTVRDGQGQESQATLSVTVNKVNDAPVAVDDAVSVQSAAVLENINVLANDADADNDALLVTDAESANGATITINADGTLNYQAAEGFTGLDTVTYTISDGAGGTSSATLSVTVELGAVAPVAVNDGVGAIEDTLLENINVLANDRDANGDALTVTSAVSAAGGVVTINADGSLNYLPPADFNGEDTITYSISDGNDGVSSATLTITVAGVNDAPVVTPGTLETLEDTNIAQLNVLANVIDVDGDPITLVSVESSAGGTLTLNDDGTVNYVPAANYFGSDTLTYTATGSAGEAITGSITIDILSVNDAPVVAGERISTQEDTPVDNIVVLTNDSDIEGDALRVTDAISINGGSVEINEDNTLTYTPPADFNGEDTIEYTVTDAGGASTVGGVLVAVSPVDDQPIARTLPLSTGEGVVMVGDLNDGVESGDAPNTFALTLGAEPQHGEVTINDDGTFVYTPDADFSGIERFGYTVTDEDGDRAASVVIVTVVADGFQANLASDLANDVPVAADDNYSVNEDQKITGSVLGNDDLSEDVGGTNIVTIAEGDGPDNGTLVMSEAGVFVYTPEPDFFGQDTFTYTLTDASGDTSTATVTLNVVGVNDDARFEGAVTGTMDEDGGRDLSIVGEVEADAGGLTVADQPAIEAEAPKAIAITGILSVSDTGGVLEDTEEPGLNSLGSAAGFRIASPVEGDYLQAQGGVATIDADGNWAYTPNANFNGPDSFTVLVTDDLGNVESQVINVTVEAVADLSAADDAASVDEDGVLEASVADNDSTISGGALTYALAAGATTANGELLFNEDGSYTYTPNTDYYGPDSFSYVVTDAASGESSTQTVTITVNPVVEANSITIDAIEGDSGVADDFQTNDTTLTVSGSLEKVIASDERVEISTDGGATWTTATVDGTNWSFEDPTAQDASFTYEARIAGPGDSVGATAEQAVTIDTTPPVATIQLDDAITADNIINAQESGEAITIAGSVGGDVRAGDTVTLTVNGVQSQGVVESVEGALRFSAEVQGSDLVADGDLTIDAAITTTDDAGNISEVATDVQTYTVDLEASRNHHG